MLHAANARLAGLGERRVVVLVGAADAAMARRAADAARTELLRDAGVLRVVVDTPADATVLVQALTPWRDRLLTTAQRRELAGMDVDLAAQRALAALYQPFGTARLTPFAVDPLTLWPDWWRERASASRARPQDGLLMLEGEGEHWVLLNFDAAGSAFSVTGDLPVSVKVATARVAAQAVSAGAVLLAAGVPLHAEAAAAQAKELTGSHASSTLWRRSPITDSGGKSTPNTLPANSASSSPAEAPVPNVAEVATGVALPSGRPGSAAPRVAPNRRSSIATSVPWAPS